jgi:hypothetical protein
MSLMPIATTSTLDYEDRYFTAILFDSAKQRPWPVLVHYCPYCGDEVEMTDSSWEPVAFASAQRRTDHGYWLHVDDNTPICAEEAS